MERLKSELNILNSNFEELLHDIGLSKKDIYELCKIKGLGNLTSLSIEEGDRIADKLNIDLSELKSKTICRKTIKTQLEGNSLTIREGLIGNRGTRLKTVSSALSLVDKKSRKLILRKYQLKEEVLAFESRLVSAELIKSIFNDLAKFSYAKESDVVGHVNCKNFLKSEIKGELNQFKSPAEAYSYFLEYCTTVVEKNMDYTILSATPNRIVFKYETKESVKDFFSVKHFGNLNFCQNIQGFFEELVKYRYTYPAKVRKISCAHLGQNTCTYEIVFDGIVTH
ncbi:MAG: hypothetical protein ACJAT2_003816 [Bacteriovoracaceae bacterium]|jgi:hypothetical protein